MKLLFKRFVTLLILTKSLVIPGDLSEAVINRFKSTPSDFTVSFYEQ